MAESSIFAPQDLAAVPGSPSHHQHWGKGLGHHKLLAEGVGRH